MTATSIALVTSPRARPREVDACHALQFPFSELQYASFVAGKAMERRVSHSVV